MPKRIQRFDLQHRAHLSYKSVGELPDFPCDSYGDLMKAIDSGEVLALLPSAVVNHDKSIVWRLGSVVAKMCYVLLAAVPFAFALALTIAAIVWQKNWFFLAIPAWGVGVVCASANRNLADGCLAQVIMALAAVLAFFIDSTIVLVGLGCWISWLLTSYAIAIPFQIASHALRKSEVAFLWMYERGTISVSKAREQHVATTP